MVLEWYEIYYSCIPDCNDVNSQGNINEDPLFAYSYPEYGYYHLKSDSDCIEAGDRDISYSGQVDIDGDDRIYGTYVDIGADENICSDVSNAIDLNADGAVNFEDFGMIAGAWLTIDPNHVDAGTYPEKVINWNSVCDLDDDLDVDLEDLVIFVPEWLWFACWQNDLSAPMGMQSMSSVESSAYATTSPQVAKPEPSIEEQYAQAKGIADFLEDLWASDEEIKNVIDKKDWKKFVDAVNDWLDEIDQELQIK